jgi:hypothetical protein
MVKDGRFQRLVYSRLTSFFVENRGLNKKASNLLLYYAKPPVKGGDGFLYALPVPRRKRVE